MNALAHEMRLLLRSRASVAALLVLLALASLAVLAGLREQQRQQHTIARLLQEHEQQQAQSAPPATARTGDAGSAAYYTFHATWSPPSPASFMALGLRDSSPYVLRVRALALQAQLHEGETVNPELALAGRLDHAFVLVYLAPLFLIALLYDLVSAERTAGRLGTLRALPGGDHRLWRRRAALRTGLAFAALALPLLAAAASTSMPWSALGIALTAALAYITLWTALALLVAARGWRSSTNAIALVGAWALLTLVLPTLAHTLIAQAAPAHQGADLMLDQRQAVHGAWDEPREQTMARFFHHHPEWRDTAPLPAGFHWKWYYAFQQLGDEHVADQVADYRAALLARQRWTVWAGTLLPSVAVQTVLHRAAETDLPAQLAYQDAIARFHTRLREFYYPYLFRDRTFGAADFSTQPMYEPPVLQGGGTAGPLTELVTLVLLAMAGARSTWRRQGCH